MERLNRGRSGNPNFYKGMPSNNPDGRSKETPGFRARMRDWMTAKGEAILKAMAEQDECKEDRRFALQLIAAYAHHKPVTPAAIAIQDSTPRITIVQASPRRIENQS
jgi:hypothetical protein